MKRRREPELMDDPRVDPGEHRAALDALRRSNRMLGFDGRLAELAAGVAPRPEPRVLEVGAGGGGLMASLAGRFQRMEHQCRLIGLDRSAVAIADAAAHVGMPQNFEFVVGDALRLPFADRSIDVVICSLLLHHFDPDDAIELLREASRVARHAVVVGDLSRSGFAWVLTWLFTRLFSRSRLFHVDGPRSVRAAYRPAEAIQLAARAGMGSARVCRVFPLRWTMMWRREESGVGRRIDFVDAPT